MTERTTAEVLDDHLRLRSAGDLETDIERNYAPDVVQLCEGGVLHGLEGVRASAAELARQAPNAHFTYRSVQVEGEFGFLSWSAESDHARIPDGADSYVIRNGRIVMQSIFYRVEGRG